MKETHHPQLEHFKLHGNCLSFTQKLFFEPLINFFKENNAKMVTMSVFSGIVTLFFLYLGRVHV